MVPSALALLASLVCLPFCSAALPVANNGGGFVSLSGAEIHVAPGESLSDALLLAAENTAASGGPPAAPRSRPEIVLQAGTHRIQQPLQIPSGVVIRGVGDATISGSVPIKGWAPEPDRPWLYRAPLPALLQSKPIYQLWVGGQRRGSGRSPTMMFANVTSTGIRAREGQLMSSYRNVSAMRVLLYQHWTASFRKVVAIDHISGAITLDAPPPPMTGDANSGSRYFLENAPEYLSKGSGTFYADAESIMYAPLDAEEPSSALNTVVAAMPGLFELISNNGTQDVSIEGLRFAHTDVDFEACFAGPCALQSATFVSTAAVHFVFSKNISMHRCIVENVGGYGVNFGAGVRDARFSHGRIEDLAAGGVRIGEASGYENGTEYRTAKNVTVSDTVIRDGGNVFRAGMGVLVQAAADCTITHNSITMFRQTGVSIGWKWNYGVTSNGNNTISYNNISTIGMGETSDLGCVYHLGMDIGTTIHGNVCSNVSSFDYGAMGYYLDQASQYVTVTDNIAYDTKCAGFLQNFGLNCTIANNVLAFVNNNEFYPGDMFAGQTCAGNTGSAVFNAGPATGPQRAAFNFTRNIVYWENGPLLGGGTSIFVSSFSNNLYYNPTDTTLRGSGFPCPQSFGPVDPSTADGVIYNGQSLMFGQTLLSHNKQSWAAILANGSLCVGQGTQTGQHAVWCSPDNNGVHPDRVTVQGDGNLCVTNVSAPSWCAQPPHCPEQGEYFARLGDNCTLCMYKDNYPPPGNAQTWCTPGACNVVHKGIGATKDIGCSLAQWQAKGYDLGSQIDDPQFVNAVARDFRLKPSSPALRMGIHSIDTASTVGPRRL